MRDLAGPTRKSRAGTGAYAPAEVTDLGYELALPGDTRDPQSWPRRILEKNSIYQNFMLRWFPHIPDHPVMPSPQNQKARTAPSPFSLSLPFSGAMRPMGREDLRRGALVRFRGEDYANGTLTGTGELTLGSRGNDFVRNSALRDKDMPSLMYLPCLVFVWTAPRNGDMGRALLRARRAIARRAEEGLRRRVHGQARQDDAR
jgi:hypothetical protein